MQLSCDVCHDHVFNIRQNYISAEASLNCYSDAQDLEQKESCGMQTGCIKKFYTKSESVYPQSRLDTIL